MANQALRICTGAFRTSPISSLQAISSEPPLHLRRELAMKYIIKLHANPSNPTYDTIFRHQPSPLFNTKWKAIPPVSIKMASSLSLSSLSSNNIPFVITQFSSVPAWTLKSSTILFNLTTNIKSNTIPEVYQALYNELEQTYPNHQEIFPDGSKSSTKVSATVFSSTQNDHSLLTYQLCLVALQQNLQP